MPKKKKNTQWFSTFLPLLVSFGALAISVLSYYDTHVKVNHEVWLSSFESYHRVEADTSYLNLAVLNRGNRSELIVEVNIAINESVRFDTIPPEIILDTLTYKGAHIKESDGGEEFVIEAGDVKQLTLAIEKFPLSEGIFPVWLVVDFIDDKGIQKSARNAIGFASTISKYWNGITIGNKSFDLFKED